MMFNPNHAHLLFEQSGVFRDAFMRHGIPATCYDVRNDYGHTDELVNLFSEVYMALAGRHTILDKITDRDIVFAFFPCTYFTYAGLPQYKGNELVSQTLISSERMDKTAEYFKNLMNLIRLATYRHWNLIIENPYPRTLLSMYMPFQPAVVDYDRTTRGDKFAKSTAFWFFGFEPSHQEPLPDYPSNLDRKKVNDFTTRQRSEITPEYAYNFIADFILNKPRPRTQLSLV